MATPSSKDLPSLVELFGLVNLVAEEISGLASALAQHAKAKHDGEEFPVLAMCDRLESLSVTLYDIAEAKGTTREEYSTRLHYADDVLLRVPDSTTPAAEPESPEEPGMSPAEVVAKVRGIVEENRTLRGTQPDSPSEEEVVARGKALLKEGKRIAKQARKGASHG